MNTRFSRWSFLSLILLLLVACRDRPIGGGYGPQYPPGPGGPGFVDTGFTAPVQTGSVKSSTAYIQVRPPERLRNLFMSIATGGGLPDEVRDVFAGYANRLGSGSGFVLASGGQRGFSWIVTNRHVVDDAEDASVSFDGGNTLTRASIQYVDDRYDLAIVRLEHQMPGLSLQMSYEETQEVDAVGYPALLSKGSYQATRGTISNACIKDSDFFSGASDQCWIQHSAAIDPGSSGGPLVMRGQVVGVNTRMMRGRQGVYLAVPSKHVQEVVAKANEIEANRQNPAWRTKQLQKACHRLMSELSSSEPQLKNLTPYVATKLVAEKGLEAFMRNGNPFVTRVFLEDPYAGMQFAILARMGAIFDTMGGIARSENCSNINPSDDVVAAGSEVRVTVDFHGGGRGEFKWLFERGVWRLSGY